MEIIKMLLTPNRYSRPKYKLNRVTGIVVHYVGNAGSSASGNRNYFESLKNTKKTYSSSNYIIGLQGEIIMCVPENEVAYASNNRNFDTISIENCHPDKSGKFTAETRNSLIELCADICYRYNLNPLTDIIRHYDITGKKCPLYWVNNEQDFIKFKGEVNKMLERLNYLEKEILALKQNISKTYLTIEDIPLWAKETVEKLIKKGAIQGEDENLNLNYDTLRLLVINNRLGLYD